MTTTTDVVVVVVVAATVGQCAFFQDDCLFTVLFCSKTERGDYLTRPSFITHCVSFELSRNDFLPPIPLPAMEGAAGRGSFHTHCFNVVIVGRLLRV